MCVLRLFVPAYIALALSACGALHKPTAAEQKSDPLAPLIGEPCLVRVHGDKVLFAGLADPLAPFEETTPQSGFRFIAVGFRIGDQQLVAVDDYVVEVKGAGDPLFPLAVGGEKFAVPNVFYDPDEFAEVVQLTKAAAETNGLDRQSSDGPLLVSWGTPAAILLLIYEIPADAKTVTLRHGQRAFELQPDRGLIDGRHPLPAS